MTLLPPEMGHEPFFYLVIGHRQGLLTVGYYLADTYRISGTKLFLESFLQKFPDALFDLDRRKSQLSKHFDEMSLVSKKSGFMQKAVCTVIVKKLKKNIQTVLNTFDQVLEDVLEDGEIDEAEIRMLSELIGGRVDIDFLRPRKWVFPLLVAVNILFAALLFLC